MRKYKCVNCELKFSRKNMLKDIVCMQCSGLYSKSGVNVNVIYSVNRSRNSQGKVCDHCWPFDCRC